MKYPFDLPDHHKLLVIKWLQAIKQYRNEYAKRNKQGNKETGAN